MSFANKVIIITGAGSGVGEGIAKHFSKLSSKLTLIDINGENLKQVGNECEMLGATKVLISNIDLNNDKELENTVERTIKKFGRIDVVINNAGIFLPGKITDDNLMENYDKVMSVNTRAVVALTHFTAPALIKSKGCVVNISSVDAVLVTSGVLPYFISKAAVSHFSRCAALELAPKDVRVNSILLGVVKTNLLSSLNINQEQSDGIWNEIVNNTPTRRLITMQEVTDLIEYLASDKARSITGADYALDGGIMLVGIPQKVIEN